MAWKSVAICDKHWEEEEGTRVPYRVLGDIVEKCYRCDAMGDIFVRREIKDDSYLLNEDNLENSLIQFIKEEKDDV